MSAYGSIKGFIATNRPKGGICNVCHEHVPVSISGALAVHPKRGWTMLAGKRYHCKGSNNRPAKPGR